MPLRLNHAMGAIIGWCLYHYPSQARAISAKNIALCFPDLSPSEQDKLTRQSLQEGGKTLTEMAYFWMQPAEKSLGLIKRISGQEYLDLALTARCGAFISAPHLGCWELVGIYCASRSPMTTLYRPPKLASLDKLVRDGRQRAGAKVVPTSARGVRALLEAIKSGELVGILPDQDPGEGNGVFVPFFGLATNTMTLLSRLASKSGAPVIFAYAERLPHAQGYHLHFVPAAVAINDPDPMISASQVNLTLEQCVRALPTQYQWSYKRFKTRPSGDADMY